MDLNLLCGGGLIRSVKYLDERLFTDLNIRTYILSVDSQCKGDKNKSHA